MSVDLPAPFSPTSAWISPGAKEISTASRAVTPGKRFVSPFISRSGGRSRPPLCESVSTRCHELDRSLDPSLQLLALEGLHCVINAVGCHLAAELVDRSNHLALFEQRLNCRNVVEAHNLDLPRFAGRINGLHDAERHRVVRRHHALNLGMGGQQIRKYGVGFFRLPMGGGRCKHIEFSLLDGVIEAQFSLLSVVGARIALDDYHFSSLAKRLREHLTRDRK